MKGLRQLQRPPARSALQACPQPHDHGSNGALAAGIGAGPRDRSAHGAGAPWSPTFESPWADILGAPGLGIGDDEIRNPVFYPIDSGVGNGNKTPGGGKGPGKGPGK